MRPFLDKAGPSAWKAAQDLVTAVSKTSQAAGLTTAESELIKLRASQINGCAFCLDLHSRQARDAGIPQQKIDLLPVWRDSALYSDREKAVLAIAESATVLPLSEDDKADLSGAQHLLGDDTFAAAGWVAVAINAFNRISILSDHPVRPRGVDGALDEG